MSAIDEMAQALGDASALVSVPTSSAVWATIARWRHDDAEPRISGGDGLVKLIVNLSNTQKVERLANGVWTSKPCEIGSFTLIGPDEEVCFSVMGPADVLQIFTPSDVLARELDVGTPPTIRLRFQDHDPSIERYAFKLMLAVANRRTVDDISLSELMAGLGDLLAHDATRQSTVKGGLPPHRLRRVLEFISASISASEVVAIRLEQLAGLADLSPFHFARSFRETLGISPYTYVLQKRLECARSKLVNTSASVGEIGRQVGFQSHAHFSHQFRQQMGVTPSDFRMALRGRRPQRLLR
jgi:AraC family transcriptional regulator